MFRGGAVMATPSAQAESAGILSEAQSYLDLSVEELYGLLDDAIDEADAAGLPHRGIADREFWHRYVGRLKQELARQGAVASATAGLASSQAVVWAHEAGLDLTDYKIPIAIVVALAVKAFWDQLGPSDDGKGADDAAGGEHQGQ
jgi:hypothetical protein